MTPDIPRRSRRHIEPRPDHTGLRFTPFRTVSLGNGRELRLDTVEGPDGRFASARFFMRGGPSKPMEPGLPIHLSPLQLTAIVDALTAAGAVLGPNRSRETAT